MNLCKSGRGRRSQEKGSQLAAGGERATLFELSVGTPQLIVVLRVALSPPELFLGRAHLSYLLRLDN